MNRRNFLTLLATAGLGITAYRYWPDQGFINPCLDLPMPESLTQHELVQAAWAGIDASQVWDCHVHLIGMGDSGSGAWVNPDMRSLMHPMQYAQLKFFMNAACADTQNDADNSVVQRLLALHAGLAHGARLMLLAFDYHHDESGKRIPALSPFYTPNSYAARLAKQHPAAFEWIASIHPYRRDCMEALEWAAQNGARAVKWLPPAMGMNPASPLCGRFYTALVKFNLPIITHAGDEHAVQGAGAQALGNPLLLRRALDHGVRVVVAHCASEGSNTDIDIGPNAPPQSNFDLFARLMDEPRYAGLVFGDISAIAQINRATVLTTLLQRTDWHARLLNGSDYPLPGVMPLFSLRQLCDAGYLQQPDAQVLTAIRRYNPLLFDFVLKRTIRFNGQRFAPALFETRRFFQKQAG